MANEYLTRTPTSSGNRKVWTWSSWIKLPHFQGPLLPIFGAWFGDNTRYTLLGVSSIYQIAFIGGNYNTVDSSTTTNILNSTTNVFRDCGSWMHVMVVYNTTESSAEMRFQIYINGTYISDTIRNNTPPINSSTYVNALNAHFVGAYGPMAETANLSFKGEMSDVFLVDGQALTPDVFGFYKDGDGYQSSGTTQATDFRPGQWSPRAPKSIKYTINRSGGFGVNGYYLPMNDSSNPGADFHCAPNSIIKLKGEDLPQPRNGAPTTTDAYVSELRSDPFAANLVLAIPGIIGGQGGGYGDYSADIKGSGSNKTTTASGNFAMTNLSSYYGSGMRFSGSGNSNNTGGVVSVSSQSDFDFGLGDFTLECWINARVNVQDSGVFGVGNGGSQVFLSWTNGTLAWRTTGASPITAPSTIAHDQWHHVVLQSRSQLCSIIVNGVTIGTATNTTVLTAGDFIIGSWTLSKSYGFDGDIQDFRIYKGVAKYKGGFDVPKPYTPVGIESWRTTADTCKNNFATLNPLFAHVSSNTYTNGNLKAVAQGNNETATGNMAFSSGKWYWETRIFNDEMIGVAIPSQYLGGYPGQNSNGLSYHQSGNVYHNGTISYGAGWTGSTYRVIGLAVDWTNRRAYWSVDGVWHNSADPSAGTGFYNITTNAPNVAESVDALPAWRSRSSNPSEQVSVNFGQNPSFGGELTAGTFSDDSGKGLFKYAPPTGFLALCTDNLPAPAIADPGNYMRTVLYEGDNTATREVKGVGFQPDLIFFKNRDANVGWNIFDSVRGPTKQLAFETTDADVTRSGGGCFFNEDGFTVSNRANNNNSNSYVAYCWKAGGAAVSNTDGSITTQVSVNQTAGFSIVSYTANSDSPATIGHGLGKELDFIIVRNRDFAQNWYVYHSSLGPSYRTNLNDTAASFSVTGVWNGTAPSSTVFSTVQDPITFQDGDRHIAYCWAEIEGFSKFGSYDGNQSDNGTFVFCGFKPAWVMVRRTLGENWAIIDSSTSPSNPADLFLRADESTGETSAAARMDFLSNGFKLRGTDTKSNADGDTYVFVAFAESPFQTANAK